jgi:hypothetical protein
MQCSQNPATIPCNDSNGYTDGVIEHFTLPGYDVLQLGSWSFENTVFLQQVEQRFGSDFVSNSKSMVSLTPAHIFKPHLFQFYWILIFLLNCLCVQVSNLEYLCVPYFSHVRLIAPLISNSGGQFRYGRYAACTLISKPSLNRKAVWLYVPHIYWYMSVVISNS